MTSTAGMNHPFQYLAYFQFLAQEMLIDSKTPGQVPRERLQRNAQSLKDAVQALGSYWNVDMEAQMKELYKAYPDNVQQPKAKEQAKGKRRN